MMKKKMVVIIALAVLTAGGTARASDSNTLTVSASVLGTCKFMAPTSALDFGTLDPANPVAVPLTAPAPPQFWCTKGVTTDLITASMGLNPVGGVRQMKDTAAGGTDVIPYTLVLGAPTGSNAGPGSPRTLPISGTIPANSYTAVAASSYSDTVTLTLTP